jgi:hypothetical protein
MPAQNETLSTWGATSIPARNETLSTGGATLIVARNETLPTLKVDRIEPKTGHGY